MLTRNLWESAFFSKEIYILEASKWDEKNFKALVREIQLDLVESKVSASDTRTVYALCSAGFRLADVAVDFVKDIPPFAASNILGFVETLRCHMA